MPRVYIAIGSNIEPQARVLRAAQLLRARFPGIRFSSCYRNAAFGFAGADFVNAVAGFDTDLDVAALIGELHAIEELCGRRRDDPKWAPRAMDLDLLLHGDAVGELAGTRLPRADLLRRSYMLGPMAELAPALCHPVTRRTMAEIWQQLAPDSAPLTRLDIDLNRE
jgi:2-amino-4-hydroxy-6-hydroxymethyldihydropteridine diphosphokinase